MGNKILEQLTEQDRSELLTYILSLLQEKRERRRSDTIEVINIDPEGMLRNADAIRMLQQDLVTDVHNLTVEIAIRTITAGFKDQPTQQE